MIFSGYYPSCWKLMNAEFKVSMQLCDRNNIYLMEDGSVNQMGECKRSIV